MQLNMVNELSKPKKVLTYVADPSLTVGELLKTLHQEKLINLEDHKSVQIWLNEEKILLSNKTLESYNIASRDNIFILPGKDISYNESDHNIIQMKKFGFGVEEILAALSKNDNNSKKAFDYLYEEFQKKAEEEEEEVLEDVDEEFKDIQPYITLTLDSLEKVHPELYKALGSDENQLRDFCEYFKQQYFDYFEKQNNPSKEAVDEFIELFVQEVCRTNP